MKATVKTVDSEFNKYGIAYAVMVDGKIYRKYGSYEIAKMVQHVYNDAVHAT
ncbi:MAG: hypothetical protein GY941_03905, partial [Planctomycetes bacterium]|nr:hypothetical protein [Planctomycetota bacterium]